MVQRQLYLISGMSCSGKTTYAKILADSFPEGEVLLVTQDSWFKDLADIPKRDGWYDMECPEAFHCDAFVEAVCGWMAGSPAFLPEYDVERNRAVGGKLIPSRNIIIAEGLHTVLLLKERFPRSTAVYLDIPPELCLQRRINRDTALYGVPEQAVRERFLNSVLPAYIGYAAKQRNLADKRITKQEEL